MNIEYFNEILPAFAVPLGYGFLIETVVCLLGYSMFRALSLLNIKL